VLLKVDECGADMGNVAQSFNAVVDGMIFKFE
jgi:hypothetical protein